MAKQAEIGKYFYTFLCSKKIGFADDLRTIFAVPKNKYIRAMGYIPIERLLDKADNSIYKLVILAAKRTLEISEGQPKLVAVNSSLRPSDIALEEIAQGKVQLKAS